MATIQSVINDLDALLASLKLKLNDEMGVPAEPIDLPIVKKEVDWVDLPDDILTYIGKFFDVKKMEAQERFNRYVVISRKVQDADVETRWKMFGKLTKKGITLNERGKTRFLQKTLSLNKEYDVWFRKYFERIYHSKLRKMRWRYEEKYWIHQTTFKTIGDFYGNEEWKDAEHYPVGQNFKNRLPILQGNDGYATDCFAPLNLYRGKYIY
jgi:hypothetical protein